MRTNIVLDDELVEEARRYSRARTKRGLVEEALRTFVEVRSADRRREAYRRRVDGLREELDRLVLPDSPIDVLRAARDRE